MGDQPPSPTRPGDSQGQPREDKPAIDRWLAQEPSDDGVPFAWTRTREIPPEEAQSEERIKDGNTSVGSLHPLSSRQVTCGSNLSLANHIPLHHRHTEAGCGQPSNNAYDTSRLENVFARQQQECLTNVPPSSPGLETLEQLFTQVSTSLGAPETADSPGTSFRALQQDTEIDQWLDIPHIALIPEPRSDRRRVLLQQLGRLQQELSTIDSASGNQQPLASELWAFNSNLNSSHGFPADGTSVTHATASLSRLDTNQPRGYTPLCHPGLIPSRSSANPSLTEPWIYDSSTIPSYSSDAHSRVMDDALSDMTFPTTPTTNPSLYHNNIQPYNLEPAQILHSNPVMMIKPTPNNLDTQGYDSESVAQHAMKRIRPSQHCKSGRRSKKRRVDNTREDESDMHSYNCPFYLKNPTEYGVGNWELCAKSRWRTYQRMREHLLRKHIRPAILCEKCFEEFEDDDSLREHFESPCERKAHSPYMSIEQQTQLQTRIKGGMQEAKKLEQMYHSFSINGAFPNPERNRQIRVEMSLRSAIALSLIPPGDIERITNDTLQAIRRAGLTGGIEHEHNSQGCDGMKNELAVSGGIAEHAPVDIVDNGHNEFLHLGN
ncbi:hypothetical protein GGI35DRAFT_380313 [Trichoderma velutinum]